MAWQSNLIRPPSHPSRLVTVMTVAFGAWTGVAASGSERPLTGRKSPFESGAKHMILYTLRASSIEGSAAEVAGGAGRRRNRAAPARNGRDYTSRVRRPGPLRRRAP